MDATQSQPKGAQDDLAYWLRLQLSAGVGPVTGRALLSHFGLPEQIFSAGAAALRAVAGAAVAQCLSEPPSAALSRQIDLTLAWLAQPGNAVLTLADPAYPAALLHIADPPLLLYVKGRPGLLAGPALAVVGSRNASAQGLANAEHFSYDLSQAGLCIVSGLATGIDTAAHQGGLHGRGSTIAVIGTGADIVYPRRNRELAHRIAEQGCLVSEYGLGVPALPANFPRRNRLISGLALGVLVIEAAARSGSLITARMAGEHGREVFAVPGSIHSALAKGCHILIKQGAKLVETAEDVLQELPAWRDSAQGLIGACPGAAPSPAEPAPGQHAALLAALAYDPVGADLLAERTKLSAAELMAQLLDLELAGLVERLPGGLFQRCAA
ncbi:MAG: DNA-processing protein DprA [Pseudomonadota bacterium]